jgi:O-glycosyl hydrolase
MGESNVVARPSSNRRAADFRSQNFRDERRRKFFRTLAKHAYPRQTANELRVLTRKRYAERTIYDWISGKSDAPMSVCIQIMGEILSD